MGLSSGEQRGTQGTTHNPGDVRPNDLWGGGERYAFELAHAQSALVKTRLVGFGAESSQEQVDGLRVRTLKPRLNLYGKPGNPLSEALVVEILRANVVHLHQFQRGAAPVAGRLNARICW